MFSVHPCKELIRTPIRPMHKAVSNVSQLWKPAQVCVTLVGRFLNKSGGSKRRTAKQQTVRVACSDKKSNPSITLGGHFSRAVNGTKIRFPESSTP